MVLPIHSARSPAFNYEEIPPGYYYQAMQSGAPSQRFWHREKFREVARRIKSGSRVLDIGCGPGSFIDVLSEMNPTASAVGVDVARGQIDFARDTVKAKHSDKQIDFLAVGESPKRWPLDRQSFDVVTCIEVIEHLHPYSAIETLNAARELLKPNGRLILTTPNYRSLWPLIELALEVLSPVKYVEQHISKFTPNSVVKFVESAGFLVAGISSTFIVAPFVAGISPRLARNLQRLEQRLPGHLGSLLIVEGTAMDVSSLGAPEPAK